MSHVGIIYFTSLGFYLIIKGIRLRVKLDPNCEDYESQRKQSYKCIFGGFISLSFNIIFLDRIINRGLI